MRRVQWIFLNLKADFILANPPFNVSDWGGDRLREDVRWQFGVPPEDNANYAWLQHIYWHLSPNGTAGVVLANGSMSTNQSGEGEIRKAMLEADVVDCMVALPGQLFYSTQIPACLWFLARNKNPANGKAGGLRDRRGQVLFIDARKMGVLVDRTHRELTDEEIQKIRPHLPRLAPACRQGRRRTGRGRIRRHPWLLQIRHARRNPQTRLCAHPRSLRGRSGSRRRRRAVRGKDGAPLGTVAAAAGRGGKARCGD
jgi:hypothetical protein